MPRFRPLWLCALIAACHADPAKVLMGPRESVLAGASAPQTEPLAVHLNVSSADNPCEDCVDIHAEASGGSAPYTFVWNVPELAGAGPHRVCPHRSTPVVALVIDSTNHSSVATTALTCPALGEPPPPVAGGCTTRPPLDVTATCETLSGLPTVVSNQLAQPLVAGRGYRATLDLQSIQLSIGMGLAAEVYGGVSPCAREQLLGKIILDPAQSHYEFCFVADRPHAYFVAAQLPGTISLGLVLVQGSVFCESSCGE